MPGSISTEAVVLGSRKLREADRIVTLFTFDLGKAPVVVKGVRKVTSRFGGRLEPFTQLEVRLHRGRSLHTLTGADTIRTRAAARSCPAALRAGLSFINLLGRETNELERRPRTFNLVARFLDVLDALAKSDVEDEYYVRLALAADLKLLLLAGYLPSLISCAGCGAEEELASFSARAGGAVCSGCAGEDSFPISAAALEEMRNTLEYPLSETRAAPQEAAAREIWRAVREICRYHLGIDLKVPPWWSEPARRPG